MFALRTVCEHHPGARVRTGDRALAPRRPRSPVGEGAHDDLLSITLVETFTAGISGGPLAIMCLDVQIGQGDRAQNLAVGR